MIFCLLRQKGGTTVAEIEKATGWVGHSIRGFFSGVKRREGITLQSKKVDGVRRYRIGK